MKLLDMKLKIAVMMGLLLLVGMVLLDMVMVFAYQRSMLDAEKEKGGILLELIGGQTYTISEGDVAIPGTGGEEDVRQVLASSNVVAAVRLNSRGETHWVQTSGVVASADRLQRVCRDAMGQQSTVVDTFGSTWGIFWRQKKYLAVARPMFDSDRMVGGAGVLINLEPVFSRLRSVQKFIGYYLLINAIILSMVGLYRIQQLVLRPIQRIIGRAESFRSGDGAFTLEEAGESEISRLSRSINRVFDLNRQDQEKLKGTVSRLEDAMARLKLAQQEIIRAEKLATVGRLSSGIAHEIGNPVGIVIGYLELIKQAVGDNAETRDYIHRAESEVERIRAIIRQLLDYSRPSEESRKSISVNDLLEDALQMARIQPLFADLDVQSKLGAEHDVVSGDPDQLKQVFLNFILNAADAIKMGGKESPGRLRITSEFLAGSNRSRADSSGTLCIRFEDNGVGMPAADLNRIFDPFFTTKPPGMGSGLGLWVSFLIVEGMGGTIDAESTQGEGTQMTLVLPVEDGEKGPRSKV